MVRLAVAGNPGSFSHQAGQLYCTGHGLTDVEFIYGIDSPGAFKAMAEGTAEKAVVPIYNTAGGLVHMTLQAMGRYQFTIQETFDFRVQQCLLSLPNVSADAIERIASHPQALSQCRNYLNQNWPKRELQEYQDTALAAQDLRDGKLGQYTAVIAPKLCAELYGLQLIAEGIQDVENNVTTFLVVYPTLNPSPDRGGKPPPAEEGVNP